MDVISNMLVHIKNCQARNAEFVDVPFSKMKYAIANILKDNGLVGEVEKKKKKMKKSEVDILHIGLKYNQGTGAISGIKFLSKPSRHMYSGKNKLYPVRSGFGFSVISTSKGIMTGQQARKAGVGGEMLFEVW